LAGYFFLGIALLLSLLLIARGVVSADPRALAKGVRYGGGAAAIGIAIFLIVNDRWPLALMALGAALPLVMRWRALRDRVQAARGPSPGQRTEIATEMLRMTLDHDSGAMSGSVIKGMYAGRDLASLGLDELSVLLEVCRAEDPPAVALLESYLERRFGSDWGQEPGAAGPKSDRSRSDQPGAGSRSGSRVRSADSGQMTRHEAFEILGLADEATPDQSKESYRRLMAKLHPDTGGSAYLAVKLNQAKALLLGD
jgi:hypothetical protein